MSRKLRYPKIVGKSPMEQADELRRYLFTLVDDLNYLFSISATTGDNTASDSALSSTDPYFEFKHSLSLINSSLEEMKSSIGSAKTELDGIIDRVIESGESNGFTYKKWQSGRYELFGESTVTCTSAATAMGSTFITQLFQLTIPFAVESAIVSGSASNNFFVVNGSKAPTGNGITFHLLSPTTFAVGNSVTVRLYITGNFIKEDETSG